MIVNFDRVPLGWVHPLYHRRRHHHLNSLLCDWDSFLEPTMDTVSSFSRMLQFTQQEPRVFQTSSRHVDIQRSDNFEVMVDVQQFSLEELEVKMVDNFIVIEGKHEEKQDDQGCISRHFVRRHQLPGDVELEMITCTLSSDGILSVTAPRMVKQKQTIERIVPIYLTEQPAAVTKSQEDIHIVEIDSS